MVVFVIDGQEEAYNEALGQAWGAAVRENSLDGLALSARLVWALRAGLAGWAGWMGWAG